MSMQSAEDYYMTPPDDAEETTQQKLDAWRDKHRPLIVAAIKKAYAENSTQIGISIDVMTFGVSPAYVEAAKIGADTPSLQKGQQFILSAIQHGDMDDVLAIAEEDFLQGAW